MSKKKAAVIIGIAALLAAAGGVGYYYRDEIVRRFASTNDRVYVEKVGRIMNRYYGIANRYNGIVEAQDTHDINVDSNLTISEVLVEVGDMVSEGQTLVTYDTKEIELQQRQAELEYEGIKNEIESHRRQIETLKAERDKVEESDKFSYTTEIQSLENSIEQSEFDLESKQLEIDKFKEQLEAASVVSKFSGIVREINEDGVDENGDNTAFMKIQEIGGYRIKGSIDEQNIWTITEGQSLVIHSRADAEVTWNGTVSKIDTDNAVASSRDEYDDSSGESSTKYPFYVELDSEEGLLLGQHVYMELDEGQLEEKEGLWLYSYYLVFDDEEEEDEDESLENEDTESDDLEDLDFDYDYDYDTETVDDITLTAYVWVANENNRLEKRYVELGEYDVELDEYEILSGLTEEDYIAWPIDGLYEGVITVTSMEEVDYTSPLYNGGDTEEYEPEEYEPDDYDSDDYDSDDYDFDDYDFDDTDTDDYDMYDGGDEDDIFDIDDIEDAGDDV